MKRLVWLTILCSILTFTGTNAGESFVFAVIGDTRPPYGSSSFRNFEEQLQRIVSFKPALLINLGDLIYGYGGKPTDSAWAAYDSIISDFHLPYHQVPGNHDIFSLKAQDEYRRQFNKLYYSFDTAGCHFVMIDNTEDAQWGYISPRQIQWLERDLAAAKSSRTFVFMHLPAWKQPLVGKEHFLVWKDRIHPLFRNSGVKAVFAGHVHSYGPTETIDGIPYFITGGGGAELDKHYAAAGGDFHFMLVDTKDSALNWSIITANSVFDEQGASVEQNRSFASNHVRSLLLSYEKLKAVPTQRIDVDIENPYNSPLIGKALWADSADLYAISPREVAVNIAPHTHTHYQFMARPGSMSGEFPMLRFDVTSGNNHHVFTKDLIIHRNFPVSKAVVSPVIDGKLDEWPNTSRIELAGSQLAKPMAWVQTAWNKNALWIAASVHLASNSRQEVLRANPLNSALIIGIDRNFTRSETDNNDLQIEISRDSTGIVLYDRSKGEQLNPVESGISASVSDSSDSAVVYEVELPAAFLNPLALRRNAHFGINFGVVTADSSGGRQLISWTPGIGYEGFENSFKSQAHFTEAILK